jgi:hypothetical protein
MPVGRPKKRSRIAVRNNKTGQIAPGNNEDLSFDEHRISGRSDVVVEDVMSDDEDESVSASLQGSQLNCCWADAAEPLFPARFLDVALQEHASGHQHAAGHRRTSHPNTVGGGHSSNSTSPNATAMGNGGPLNNNADDVAGASHHDTGGVTVALGEDMGGL